MKVNYNRMFFRGKRILILAFAFSLFGCSWFKTEPLKVEYQLTSPSDWGFSDGTISLQISGGYPPYKIQWSNDATSQELNNLKAGNYLAMVEDNKGKTLLLNIRLDHLQGPLCVDFEGNKYKTMLVRDLAWMTENLKVKKNAKGELISYKYPGNDSLNETGYGLLYDWETAMNGDKLEGSAGICPDGWHIPGDAEWKKLTDAFPLSKIGKMLIDTTMGFNLQAAGFYSTDAFGFGTSANFWTSTKCDDNAWKRFIHAGQGGIFRYHGNIKHAYSVRCVKEFKRSRPEL